MSESILNVSIPVFDVQTKSELVTDKANEIVKCCETVLKCGHISDCVLYSQILYTGRMPIVKVREYVEFNLNKIQDNMPESTKLAANILTERGYKVKPIAYGICSEYHIIKYIVEV